MRAPRRHPRGQAVTELALGVLVLVPVILLGLFLAEATEFKLEATEAATEPLWDATAHQQQAYVGPFNRTPGAVANATAAANNRMRPRTLVFTHATAPRVQCTAGNGLAFPIAATASVYTDNGGISCRSSLTVDPQTMNRAFLDQSPSGFFKEPLTRAARAFNFCESKSCNGFVMAIGDWGLTNVGTEPEECRLTMDGCANEGLFNSSKTIYEQNRTAAGTRHRAYVDFVQGVVQELPNDFPRMTDFQISVRNEESDFTERVPVVEGEGQWKTSPALGAWASSYGARTEHFLGR